MKEKKKRVDPIDVILPSENTQITSYGVNGSRCQKKNLRGNNTSGTFYAEDSVTQFISLVAR